MADSVSKKKRSAIMRSVRQKDTQPEMIVRRIAHASGARYRLHHKKLPGSPDLVFAKRNLCLFVHGCFWHRHPGCNLSSTPSSNMLFWKDKFKKNMERDAKNLRELQTLGWRTAVIWECETRNKDELTKKLKSIIFAN